MVRDVRIHMKLCNLGSCCYDNKFILGTLFNLIHAISFDELLRRGRDTSLSLLNLGLRLNGTAMNWRQERTARAAARGSDTLYMHAMESCEEACSKQHADFKLESCFFRASIINNWWMQHRFTPGATESGKKISLSSLHLDLLSFSK